MKTAADPRHLQRQKIVQELFAWQSQSQSAAQLQNDKSRQIAKNIRSVDQAVKQCAPEWEIDKINHIDLAILRLAVFELIIEASEPSKVVIDEAIELAKEFGTESSPGFINGALGNCLKSPARIKKIISEKLGVDLEKVTSDAKFKTDLNATDLEVSDLLTFVEKDYSLSISTGASVQTVGELIEYIEDQIE